MEKVNSRVRLARWESRGGKYWVEFWKDAHGYSYRSGTKYGQDAAGFFGQLGVNDSWSRLKARVSAGEFQDDLNKTPMILVSYKYKTIFVLAEGDRFAC